MYHKFRNFPQQTGGKRCIDTKAAWCTLNPFPLGDLHRQKCTPALSTSFPWIKTLIDKLPLNKYKRKYLEDYKKKKKEELDVMCFDLIHSGVLFQGQMKTLFGKKFLGLHTSFTRCVMREQHNDDI